MDDRKASFNNETPRRRYYEDENRRQDRSRRSGGNFGAMNDGDPVAFDKNSRLSPFRGEVIPLEDRPRYLKNWDATPPGFERIPADRAKLTGLFPPPGNVAKIMSYQPPTLDPARRAMLEMLSGGDMGIGPLTPIAPPANFAKESDPNPNTPAAKQARRIYIGNLPLGISDDALVVFLNKCMSKLDPTKGDCVASAAVSQERNYAFADLKTSDDATSAQQLDGVTLEGQVLKVGRPREFQEVTTAVATAGLNLTPTGNNYVVVTGFPLFLTEAHIKHLVQPFGDLRTFALLKDEEDDSSIGIAAFDYLESDLGRAFCEEVDGSPLGDYTLRARSIAQCYAEDPDLSAVLAKHHFTPGLATATEPTPILLLLNMLPDDLDDKQIDDITADILGECSNYGTIDQIFIPPTHLHGIRKVLIKYSGVEEAKLALSKVAGRKFGTKTTVAAFFPIDRFEVGDFA